MVHVDHQVARAKVAEVGHERRHSGSTAARAGRCGQIAAAVDHEPAVPAEATLELADGDRHVTGRRRPSHRHHLTVDQEMPEPVDLPVGGHHQHLSQIERPAVAKRRHQVRDPPDEALSRVGRQPPPSGGAVRDLESLDPEVGLLEPVPDRFEIDQQPFGLGKADVAVGEGLPLSLLDLQPSPQLPQRLVAIAQHHGVDELSPGGPGAGDGQRTPPESALRPFPHQACQRRVMSFDGGHGDRALLLPFRERVERGHLDGLEQVPAAPLRRRIERLDAIDRDIVELDAQPGLAAGVEVHDPAANRELSGLLDQVDPTVSGRNQPRRELAGIDLVATFDPDSSSGELGRIRYRREQHPRRCDHHINLARREPQQQPDEVEPRGERGLRSLVRRSTLGGDRPDSDFGCQQRHAGDEIGRLRNVGNHHQRSSGGRSVARQRREHQRSRTGGDAADRQRPRPGADRVGELLQFGEWVLIHGSGVRKSDFEARDGDPAASRVRLTGIGPVDPACSVSSEVMSYRAPRGGSAASNPEARIPRLASGLGPHISPTFCCGRRCTTPGGAFSPQGARRAVKYASAPLGSKTPPCTVPPHPRDETR